MMSWPSINRAVAGATEFTSMYESFADLTTVNKQHFVEWFSGSALDSIWTKTDISGTGTFAMVDAVDEGFSLTCGGAGGESAINFNDKRQYSQTASVIIGIVKGNNTTGSFKLELQNNKSFSDTGGVSHFVGYEFHTSVTNFALRSSDNSVISRTESDIARDNSWHTASLTLTSGNCNLAIDGVSKVDKTTNLPADKLQPRLWSGSSAQEARIRYCEAYNT